MSRQQSMIVDPIACTGHGVCAELLPELIDLDDWGYPLLPDRPLPRELHGAARRAVAACPTLALRLQSSSPTTKAVDGASSTSGRARERP